ncbi:serine protease [Dokdonia sp. R78006]|uniref:S1 family peptidase n=1 Tax=Dokdonia sp. R78006 TaxID=3093866 RepID=UPI0036D23E98
METKEIWKKINPSVCQIIHRKNKRVISVGTGFKCQNHIITNNHVYNPTNSEEITIQFKQGDGKGVSLEKKYSSDEFISLLKDGMPKDSWDFAVLEDSHFSEIPNLKLIDEKNEIDIGQKCVFLGFPFSSNYLTIHEAIISAKYTNSKNNVKYIQLDASVNGGNSGGPLIDVETQEVIGIITLKKTGFSDRFRELNDSFKSNIEVLEQSGGATIQMSGIDIMKTFKAIQNQLAVLGKEMERSSNVGIGFGFELDEVRKGIK